VLRSPAYILIIASITVELAMRGMRKKDHPGLDRRRSCHRVALTL